MEALTIVVELHFTISIKKISHCIIISFISIVHQHKIYVTCYCIIISLIMSIFNHTNK